MNLSALPLLFLLTTGCAHELSTSWPAGSAWPEHFELVEPPLNEEAMRATSAAVTYVASRPYRKSLFEGCPPGKSLKATTFKAGEIYVVQVDPDLDVCPSAYTHDWFEVYAVSAEGQILARRPPAEAL